MWQLWVMTEQCHPFWMGTSASWGSWGPSMPSCLAGWLHSFVFGLPPPLLHIMGLISGILAKPHAVYGDNRIVSGYFFPLGS